VQKNVKNKQSRFASFCFS